jgi:hypothetical protein
MPCYTVRRVGFEIKAADAEVLAEALEAVGWTRGAHGASVLDVAKYIIEQGEIRVPASQEDRVTRLQRAYALKAVMKTARMYGWVVKPEGRDLLVQRG